jgi:hypothetical protein
MLVGAQALQRRAFTVEGKANRSHLILGVPAGETCCPHQGIKMIFPLFGCTSRSWAVDNLRVVSGDYDLAAARMRWFPIWLPKVT